MAPSKEMGKDLMAMHKWGTDTINHPERFGTTLARLLIGPRLSHNSHFGNQFPKIIQDGISVQIEEKENKSTKAKIVSEVRHVYLCEATENSEVREYGDRTRRNLNT